MAIPLETVLEATSYVVSGAAVLAAAIPSPNGDKASKALMFVRKILDFLAMNFAHAKNAAADQAGQSQQKVK